MNMTTINPNPGDDFCNLSVDELIVEAVRGLDRIAEGRAMVDDGEAHAGLALARLTQLFPDGEATREAYAAVTA